MGGDITNKSLGKILSLEFWVLVIGVGVAWGALTTRVSAIDDKVNSHNVKHQHEIRGVQLEQKNTAKEVGEINERLGRIEAKQDNFKERFDKQERDIEKVLDILMQQYPNGSGR